MSGIKPTLLRSPKSVERIDDIHLKKRKRADSPKNLQNKVINLSSPCRFPKNELNKPAYAIIAEPERDLPCHFSICIYGHTYVTKALYTH